MYSAAGQAAEFVYHMDRCLGSRTARRILTRPVTRF